MKNSLSRRRFLVGLGRWSFVTALGGLAGRSVVRSLGGTTGGGGLPAYLAICNGCGLLHACELPQGVEARAALEVRVALASAAHPGERGACGSIAGGSRATDGAGGEREGEGVGVFG